MPKSQSFHYIISLNHSIIHKNLKKNIVLELEKTLEANQSCFPDLTTEAQTQKVVSQKPHATCGITEERWIQSAGKGVLGPQGRLQWDADS